MRWLCFVRSIYAFLTPLLLKQGATAVGYAEVEVVVEPMGEANNHQVNILHLATTVLQCCARGGM